MTIKEQDINDLELNKELAEQLNISYYTAFSLITFHVFIIEIDKGILEETWKKINNKVAFYMQDKFANTFEKWNLYLFYLIKNECSITIKYKIENNPFSSRKIVIDDNNEKKMSHNQIISNYIFDSEIKLDSSKEKVELGELEQDSKIFNLIKTPKLELSADGRNKDKSVEKTYNKLLKAYSDEV